MSINSHSLYEVFEHQKTDLLLHLLESMPDLDKVLVIVHTRDSLHSLTSTLCHAGVRAESIHGNKKAELRDRAMKGLSEGKLRLIASTESMARDLDTSCIKNVVYFDLPELVSDYQQRVAQMHVLTLAVPGDRKLAKLESEVGIEIQRVKAPDFKYAKQPVHSKPPRKKGGKSKGLHSKPLQNKKPKLNRGRK
ncbi:hypothetical protein NT6N_26130 [Oceaniferula spumae]|uniref:Helicase C-terminal domain-containing protein n=1 Tax=Oceaniferula spumae TaxID=2979115 RepID=A0AAT9FNP7_9BACT